MSFQHIFDHRSKPKLSKQHLLSSCSQNLLPGGKKSLSNLTIFTAFLGIASRHLKNAITLINQEKGLNSSYAGRGGGQT